MEFRKIFDEIPESFDRWRPRYCREAFDAIVERAHLGPGSAALEIGPGTGQATEPILQTGCDYLAIELGEHLARFTAQKFAHYGNFHIVNDDFITHDFGPRRFDLILSAATIQWIPEEIAFPKCLALLNHGGILAMMRTIGDYRSTNEALYDQIQSIYDRFFHPEIPYAQKFTYANAVQHGFSAVEHLEFHAIRTFTADEYVQYIGTHCDHMTLKEPDRSAFFNGIRQAILDAGDRLVLNDAILLDIAQKP